MRQNKTLLILISIVFLDMLGIGILIPVIPALFTDPNGTFFILSDKQIPNALFLLGLMSSLYPLMQFFAAPILGDLSDKFGRKPVLAISMFGTAVGYFIFIIGLITRSLPLLFISRIIDGSTGGNISVAQAAIADISKPEDRGKNFGLIGAAFGVGFILGPSIGGILGNINTSYPFILATILSIISAVSILKFLPETHKNIKSSENKISITSSFKSILKGFKHPTLSRLFFVTLFISAGFTFFGSFFGAFLINIFGATEQQIGLYFAFVGVWIILTQAIINRALVKKYSTKTLVQYPIIILAFTLFLFPMAKEMWILYIITPFFSIANGLVQANLSAFISRQAGEENQGEILGINMGMSSFSQAVIPLFAGFIAMKYSVSTPLIWGSATILIAGIIFFFAAKKIKDIKINHS
jgi:DHA1 family tetracycline resistance protein-like MFS transporter